jgi:periplasmic protein TonB
MVQPLRFDETAPVKDIQFKDFGVLDTGRQSKGSFVSAVVLNSLFLAFILLIGAAAKRTLEQNKQVTMLVAPLLIKQPPPPPPPKVLPKPPVPKPVIVKIDPPRIKIPEVKLPDAPKVVKMNRPAPILAPAPPKRVVAPPAPQVVNLARPMAASVVNNSPHPSAVALGRPDNPIAPSNSPATSAVNLGQRGMAGMPASNTGGGPRATAVNLGSGSPGGQSLTGNGTQAVRGVNLGVAGGIGPNNSPGRQVGQVNLGQNVEPAAPHPTATVTSIAQRAPKVLYKPTPAYTPEAAAMHLTGAVAIRIRVSATGSVTVLDITSPLGHGLDQSAQRAIEATRFSPALDASGRPVDWEGVVHVNFEMAG